MYGGNGNDFLVSTPDINGDDGADSIYGGDGNDILLGSRRNDLLFGGAGEDFLYGGLALAPFLDALKTQIIISVWTSTQPYAERSTQPKRSRRGPGRSIRIDRTQQIVDGVVDTYIGGIGLDWFFVEPNELGTLSVGGIRDYEPEEIISLTRLTTLTRLTALSRRALARFPNARRAVLFNPRRSQGRTRQSARRLPISLSFISSSEI